MAAETFDFDDGPVGVPSEQARTLTDYQARRAYWDRVYAGLQLDAQACARSMMVRRWGLSQQFSITSCVRVFRLTKKVRRPLSIAQEVVCAHRAAEIGPAAGQPVIDEPDLAKAFDQARPCFLSFFIRCF
jgi:hypothetical protein